jgi:hypothetical protein
MTDLRDDGRTRPAHRVAATALRITDERGRALPGAQIRIRQTRQAFLVGCNAFDLCRPELWPLQALYGERFTGLFNYATLPFYWSGYDHTEDLSPKPAYERLRDLIYAGWRQPDRRARTSERGAFRFRGVLGDYEVEAGACRGTFSLRAPVPSETVVRVR